MSKIVRSQHFRDYCQKIFVKAAQTSHAMSEQQAKDKFNENLYDDFNTLCWIMDSVFPHSRRVGEDYEFITEDIEHTHIGSKITENVGRCTIKIDDRVRIIMTFSNPKFQHGHLGPDGSTGCWGGYVPFETNICKIGFSGALMDMYNFSRNSAYSTVFPIAGQQEQVKYGYGAAGRLQG